MCWEQQKTKEPQLDSQNRSRSPIPEGGDPSIY